MNFTLKLITSNRFVLQIKNAITSLYNIGYIDPLTLGGLSTYTLENLGGE